MKAHNQASLPVFPSACSSLLKKHLSQEVWNALAGKASASGFSFEQAICSGTEQLDSSVGVYAGDEESYRLFAPLLTPIIKDYHGNAGPLILVTEFVGFLAAYKEGGLLLGLAGAVVTLWVTFIPCFLWIFACAPYIEWLSAQSRLKSALSAITAAVVGVILNLSLWFALHVLFGTITKTTAGPITLWQPELMTLDWRVAFLAIVSGVLLLKWHWNVLWVLVVAGLGGGVLSLI